MIVNLDEAGAEAAEEVFACGFGLGEGLGLVAVFEGDFLEEEVDGIFGLEALRDQLADARGEVIGVGCAEAGEMVGAFVIAEFGRCQAVIGGLGVGIGEQRGDRGVPFALRAGPSLKIVLDGPDEFAGGLLFERAASVARSSGVRGSELR